MKMTIVSFASLSYNVSLFLQASALALEFLPRSEAAKAEERKSWSGLSHNLSSFLDHTPAATSNVAPTHRIIGLAPGPTPGQQFVRIAPSSAAGGPGPALGPQETHNVNLIGQQISLEAVTQASIDNLNVSKIFQYHDQNQLINQ